MKKIFFLLLMQISFNILNAQEFHIRYINNISPVANVDEDLFISKQNITSVRDSIIRFSSEYSGNNKYNENSNSIQITSKNIPYKVIYRKNINNEKVLYQEYLGDKKYIIEDNLPQFNWKINYNFSKVIDNYTCYEAKTNYRGSNIIAYFTKEIPISSGPFKFGGLPGLILEISEEGKNYNSWKAVKIDQNQQNLININNKNSLAISMKDFLMLEEQENEKSFLKKTSGLGKDVTVKRMKVPRQGIEKKYEWENN